MDVKSQHQSQHKKMKDGSGTLRLEARLMMDRCRSLFLCAGVNSGSVAARSAQGGTHAKHLAES